MYGSIRIPLDGLVLHVDPLNNKYSQATKMINAVDKSNETNLFTGVTYENPWMVADGVNTVVRFPHSVKWDFNLEQTIVMWLRPATGSNDVRRNPYNQAYGGGGTIVHEIDTGGVLNYIFGTSGTDTTPYVTRRSTFTVLPEEIAFIAVTRSQTANQVKWYKNGKLIDTLDANATNFPEVVSGTNPILIGDGYTNNFSGKIGFTSVYTRALTEQEIFDYYTNTKNRYLNLF